MPIDPADRIANYTRKITPSRTAGIITKRVVEMKENFGFTANDIVAMETQVRQVCNGAGVPTIQYPFYLCFGRELWALQRRGIAGESLAVEAAVLITKWTAQGLAEAVLQAIRTDVFDVAAPIAP
jgi:hypothetical protein